MSDQHALRSSGGEFDASNARANTSNTAPCAEQRRFGCFDACASVLQAASLRDFRSGLFKALRANTIAKKLSLRRRLVHIPLQPDKLHVHVWINNVVPPLRLEQRDDDALQRDRLLKTRS